MGKTIKLNLERKKTYNDEDSEDLGNSVDSESLTIEDKEIDANGDSSLDFGLSLE